MAKPSQTCKLTETVLTESLTKESVDRENGVIRGVKVLGRISRNGREYSDNAMNDGARIYEGLRVNVDHPDRKNPSMERRFVEGFGELRNVVKRDDGVYGDLHFKRSHPQAELVCESAERFPKSFGLSHNAEGSLVRRSGKMVVESLTSAESVDIVGKPATNEGLFESVDPTKEKPMKVKTTVRKLIESAVLKLKRYKHAPARLLEMEGGDSALMAAPVDVMAPDEGVEPDPDEQIEEAFKSMVVAVLDDTTLDADGKIARITEILTAQDSLMSGKPADKPAETKPGDAAVAESAVLKQIQAGLTSLLESQKVTQAKQAEQDAKLSLIESKREVTSDHVKQLVEASNDDHRKALIESWPQIEAKPGMVKPKSGSIMESELKEFPDTKGFLNSIGARRVKV